MPDQTILKLGIDLNNRRPLRDEAYFTLRRAILSASIKPGARLREREVAESLGLSRSPVREAFRRLEHEGLIVVTRQGVFVQGLNLQEVTELYEARLQLEVLVVRLAARKLCPEDIPRLEGVLEAEPGIRFHEVLAEIAANRRLATLTASIREDIQRFNNLNSAAGSRAHAALIEHRGILAALAARNEDLAAKLMAEHIAISRKLTMQSQLQGGELGTNRSISER